MIILFFYFRCVSDGFCSLEQADLIQLAVEKKLAKLYKIDETVGKSLSKSLVSYDDNEDELLDEESLDKKPIPTSTEENNHTAAEEKSAESTSKPETNVDTATASMNLNNQISPSSPKSNLSPGEIKPISPSSLSEGSPVSN